MGPCNIWWAQSEKLGPAQPAAQPMGRTKARPTAIPDNNIEDKKYFG